MGATERLSVAVITCWYPSSIDPVSGIFNAHDIRAIAAEHDVHVFHLVAPHLDDGERRLEADGHRVTRIPMATWNPLHIARAARTLHAALGAFDVIHTMAFPSLMPVRLLPRRLPVLHTEHWTGITRMARGVSKPGVARIAGTVLRRADALHAVSTYLGDAMTTVSGRDVTVVPNIVEVPGEIVAGSRRHPAGAGDPLRLLAVGTLSPVKDPLLSLQVIAELRRRGLPVTLDWVGDGPLRESVEAMIEELDLAGLVTLHGRMPHGATLERMAEVDAVLHTSSEETFSIVAAESLVLGRPLIIADRGGHRDFSGADAPWAALVPERTATAYADGVERALAAWDPAAAAAYGDELLARFSSAAHATAVSAQYRRITS